jgi:hypothetical protein
VQRRLIEQKSTRNNALESTYLHTYICMYVYTCRKIGMTIALITHVLVCCSAVLLCVSLLTRVGEMEYAVRAGPA